MKLLNYIVLGCLILTFSVLIKAQNPTVLAEANNIKYTVNDLDPATREIFEGLNKNIATERTESLGEQIAQLLFKDEAEARKITIDKLLELEVPKRIPAPTAAQIQAVYDANRDAIGNKTLAEVRPQIVNFLQRDGYPKALSTFVGELKLKYKVVMGKDVNAPGLSSTDVLATVNAKPITVKDFEEKAGPNIYEIKAQTYDKTQDYLETIIFNEMVAAEAKSLNLSISDLIAREVTDKMKEFTEDEREKLNDGFEKKLTEKYGAKFYLKPPEPYVYKISVDDDPAQGKPDAPVTIVMFSDFQCPACSATHPVLKKVMEQYGDKIRFVVRDFPLTQIHQNSYKAAQAANAANAQGKFFEYIQILYKNQESLDTASLKRFAAQIGLNQQKFDADLDSGKYAVEVNKDIIEGESYGINSTPTIFINGVKARSLSAQTFKKLIDWALQNK